MTLHEMSREYRASARMLQMRLKDLRKAYRESEDEDEKFRLKRRILFLKELLTQTNELAEHTERYYERGFYRGRYSL